ncbi:gas vesicle protein [Saccharopolyspora mangrovi]|uniref:Gas vesicle protein n=1 Tax=Saccharopolyspora mangrovi TaxID=3082379 RepID=A0ABU6ACL4_9PSEU|nr:gas vesicle protein [Saccharopolyspora sp. S2-29]MEB3369198.1 gas vesicle protein [Saccharopolyspora sp. S2-29]
MTEPNGGRAGPPARYGQAGALSARSESANLADILERVLDKGIVIAGDIRVNLLDIELLTIKLRLVVASVERAREMGIDWWEHDPSLSSGQRDLAHENRRLQQKVRELESGSGSAEAPPDVDEHEEGRGG